jgi:tetratricopeptide (TPR) repeat protein
VYLHQGKYADAIALMQELLPRIRSEDEHVLRIAGWYDGRFTPPLPAAFPRMPIPFALAVRANLAVAHFLVGNQPAALQLAQEAIVVNPDNYLGYAVAGCLQFTQGESAAALKMWEQGRQIAADDNGKIVALFDKWLAGNA